MRITKFFITAEREDGSTTTIAECVWLQNHNTEALPGLTDRRVWSTTGSYRDAVETLSGSEAFALTSLCLMVGSARTDRSRFTPAVEGALNAYADRATGVDFDAATASNVLSEPKGAAT